MRVAVWGSGQQELEPLLAQFGREYGLEVAVEVVEEGLGPAAAGLYQAALLDADHPRCLEVGRLLRLRAPDCPILLFAADRQAALRGYAIHPTGFLPRPMGYGVLRRVLERCRPRWQEEARWVSLTVNRVELRVLWADILWVEVKGRVLTLHGRRGSVDSRMSMAQMEERLAGGPFLLCRRNVLVNLFRVQGWDGDRLVLEGGWQVPVSGERLDSVRVQLALFERDNGPWAAGRLPPKRTVHDKNMDFMT